MRWALGLVWVLAGCDPVDEPADREPPPEHDAEVRAAIEATHALAGVVQSEGQTSATIVAEGVFLASQLGGAGQVVTTGTLEQEGTTFAWSGDPVDRMVITFGDGTKVDVWVDEIVGDSSSATAFLQGEHRFAYRVAMRDRIDMAFTSVRQDGTTTATANGTLVHEDVSYEAAVEVQGTYFFETDSTGTHFRDAHRTTGSITAEGLELELDEGWSFELVTSGGESAQATQRTIASSLRLGDDVYDWVDATTRTSFRDGKPSELDTYWAADGEILRNGEPFGAYRLGSSATLDFVTVVVDLPHAELELERHAAY